MSNARKIDAMFVVVRQHERMNRGDGQTAPTSPDSINYYVGMQRYWDTPEDAALEAGQCIILAHVGCGVKALTFANATVNTGNEQKLSPGQVQALCWTYIEELHAASKPTPKRAKRMSEELAEQPAEATGNHHSAAEPEPTGPTDAAQDISEAVQRELE